MNEDYKTLLMNIGYRFAEANNISNINNITFDSRHDLVIMVQNCNLDAFEILNSFYEIVIEDSNEKERSDFSQISLMAWILKQEEIKLKLKRATEALIKYTSKNNININDLFII